MGRTAGWLAEERVDGAQPESGLRRAGFSQEGRKAGMLNLPMGRGAVRAGETFTFKLYP